MKIERKSRGITLVALVVTIVVLLILAGITILYVMGDNSVFHQASQAKIETELGKIEEQAGMIYANKLVENRGGSITNREIVDKLIENGNNIEIRNIGATEVTGISVEPAEVSMDINKTATIRVKIDGPEDENFYYVVIDGKYYKMNFQGAKVTIERDATTPKGNAVEHAKIEILAGYDATIVTNAQISQSEKTITVTSGTKYGNTELTVKYGSKTVACTVKVEVQLTVEEILEQYSASEIASASDGILMKILQNPTTESINKLTSSKEAMKLLGENTLAKKEIIKSDEWCKAIANSEYRSDFSEYIVYNAGTLVATGRRRNYYKSQNGFALSVIHNKNGSSVVFVGKEENAVKGWCSYDPDYVEGALSFEDENGELWYCNVIPYGWNDGTTFNSYQGKDIGNITNASYPEWPIEVAKRAVKDFLYGE